MQRTLIPLQHQAKYKAEVDNVLNAYIKAMSSRLLSNTAKYLAELAVMPISSWTRAHVPAASPPAAGVPPAPPAPARTVPAPTRTATAPAPTPTDGVAV